MSQLYMMGLITSRSLRNKYTPFFKEHNLYTTIGTLGSGTANSDILDYFGMEASEKVIYFSFVTANTWRQVKRDLYSQMKIDIPGRGIAFLVPLSSVGGKRTLQYLIVDQELAIEEESTLKNTDYELLITIANAGYIDVIMDAARSAHAPGGTVIHAKGTGAEYAKKFLGISLAEEKELVLNVVRTTQKNAIMKAIMEQAGIGTKAGAICFSLPVTSVAGIRMLADMKDMDEELE